MKYVIIFIIRLENTSKKIQSGRKVKKTKSSLLNIYLAKLDEVLGFTNKTKQIYNLNTVSQQTQNHNQKLVLLCLDYWVILISCGSESRKRYTLGLFFICLEKDFGINPA